MQFTAEQRERALLLALERQFEQTLIGRDNRELHRVTEQLLGEAYRAVMERARMQPAAEVVMRSGLNEKTGTMTKDEKLKYIAQGGTLLRKRSCKGRHVIVMRNSRHEWAELKISAGPMTETERDKWFEELLKRENYMED